MTTIAANSSSTGAALAALISGGSAAATPSVASGSTAGTSSSTGGTGLGPATIVDLSDNAKAVLAKAKSDQAVAARLAAQVTASKATKNGQAATGPTFEQIVSSAKQSQAQTGTSLDQFSDPTAIQKDTGGYLVAEQQAHQRPDGTFSSWSQSFSDVTDQAPSTPDELNNWYATQGKQLLSQAQAFGSEPAYAGLEQALNNQTVTITAAADVPGLNFHNSLSFYGGETGAGNSQGTQYNSNAAALNVPGQNWMVTGSGLLVTWKTDGGSNSAGS